eukprot:3366773-Rhodomonas_salina.1
MSALRTRPPRRRGISHGASNRDCTGLEPGASCWLNNCFFRGPVSGGSGPPGLPASGPPVRHMQPFCKPSTQSCRWTNDA